VNPQVGEDRPDARVRARSSRCAVEGKDWIRRTKTLPSTRKKNKTQKNIASKPAFNSRPKAFGHWRESGLRRAIERRYKPSEKPMLAAALRRKIEISRAWCETLEGDRARNRHDEAGMRGSLRHAYTLKFVGAGPPGGNSRST